MVAIPNLFFSNLIFGSSFMAILVATRIKEKKKYQDKEAFVAQKDFDYKPLALMVTITVGNSN